MKATNPIQMRIPPQDTEAERAVLGSLLVRPGAIHEVSDVLSQKSFYYDKFGLIYSTMIDLSLHNEPIDVLSVTNRLREKKILDQVGGQAEIVDLAQAVPASTNVRYYAEIVQKKYVLRELIKAADRIAEMGFNESEQKIEEIIEQAEKELLDMKSRPENKQYSQIKSVVIDAWEHIEKLHEHKGGLRGVPTGFTELDNMLSGLQNSDLVILAARPSVGKTTLALDIARHASLKHKTPTVIFSLEMSAQQLVNRMLASEAQVNAWSLRTGNISKESDFGQLQEALGRLSSAPIFIDDQAGTNIVRMRSIIRRIRAEHGLGLIIVDYLQLMSSMRTYDSMVNQVTEISRALKGLAKEFNVPVLALSQLSRAVESRGGRPRLSDLRDSGSIEQDADIVMFIHSEDKYKEKSERSNIIEILVEKHRNGPVGKVSLYFDEAKTTFQNLDKSFSDEDFAKAKNDKYNLDDF